MFERWQLSPLILLYVVHLDSVGHSLVAEISTRYIYLLRVLGQTCSKGCTLTIHLLDFFSDEVITLLPDELAGLEGLTDLQIEGSTDDVEVSILHVDQLGQVDLIKLEYLSRLTFRAHRDDVHGLHSDEVLKVLSILDGSW